MLTLRIEGFGTFDVEEGRRLVKVIEECGVDIGHRCGGKARCTTCRVRFHDGEPGVMTKAEHAKLQERELLGEVRLSCQIIFNRTMHVEPLIRVETEDWTDPGPEPAEEVEPEPEWFPRRELDQPGHRST